MLLFYYFATQLYFLAIRLAALRDKKANLAIKGRSGIFEKLKNINFENGKWAWIHCASLGEFEQGRPVIEALKVENPDLKILLTFFSPSGYEIRKNYEQADAVFYLPFDSPANARQFVGITRPAFVLFIKYEFWHFYLKTLHQQGIPTYLVSGIFRENQIFFKWYGGFFRKILSRFKHLFLQNAHSENLLASISIKNTTVAGDTRVDRVTDIAATTRDIPTIKSFCRNEKIFIGGSTWPPDEAILTPWINKNPADWKFILAPHDISEKHLQQIETGLAVSSVRYSKLDAKSADTASVLLIDNIGMLASLYRYGTVAYIGGAFGKGLHNTLEPLAFSLPVIFGSRYHNFEEARYLVDNGGGFTVADAAAFEKVMSRLDEPFFRKTAAAKALKYVQQNQGATEVVVGYLREG